MNKERIELFSNVVGEYKIKFRIETKLNLPITITSIPLSSCNNPIPPTVIHHGGKMVEGCYYIGVMGLTISPSVQDTITKFVMVNNDNVNECFIDSSVPHIDCSNNKNLEGVAIMRFDTTIPLELYLSDCVNLKQKLVIRNREPNIKVLNVSNTKLTKIPYSKHIKDLYCYNTLLTNIDIHNCFKIRIVKAKGNPELENINNTGIENHEYYLEID